MAELAHIAGEKSLILSSKESIALRMGASLEDSNTIVHEIFDSTKGTNSFDPNEMPVIVSNGFVIPQGGIFSDREMRVGLETGHIICDPAPGFDAGARINGSSIDVTLGNYFYSAGEQNGLGIFNYFDREDTMRYFNADPNDLDGSAIEAAPWSEVRKRLGKKAISHLADKYDHLTGIEADHPMILLGPNERILAHTNEFIGIIPPGTTSMQARSSVGRVGVSVCYDAGWGDPGFADRWTMEIKNHNEDEHVPLPTGMRVAQIVMMSTGPVQTEYAQASGNYQKTSFAAAYESVRQELGEAPDFSNFRADAISQSGLHIVSHQYRELLKANWRPGHTIPQLDKSKVHRRVPVDGLSDNWI